MDIDRIDIRLLEQLQKDARLSHAALGERVHLSPSQVSRRIARLEEAGLITGHTALLDPELLGLDVEAYTSVSLDRHDPGVGEAFEQAIQDFDEILDCLAVTGEADYILRIVVPDLKAFARLITDRADYILRIVVPDLKAFARLITDRLIKLPGVKMVRSNIGLHRIKRSHALPLTYLGAPGEQRPRIRYLEHGRG